MYAWLMYCFNAGEGIYPHILLISTSVLFGQDRSDNMYKMCTYLIIIGVEVIFEMPYQKQHFHLPLSPSIIIFIIIVIIIMLWWVVR